MQTEKKEKTHGWKASFGESGAKEYAQQVFHVHYLQQTAVSSEPLLGCIETFQFNLPDMLTNEYFIRHCLTIHDYERILQSVRKIHWLQALALSKGLTVCAVPSLTCFAKVHIPATTTTNLNSGNTYQELVKQLIHKRREELMTAPPPYAWTDTNQNKLICPHDEHVIPLPVHFISTHKLKEFPEPKLVYKQTWPFHGIEIVPKRFYHGYLLVVKVVPKRVYEQRYGPCRNVSELPEEYLIQGEVYYDTEEAFLLQTKENHSKLSQFTPEYLQGLHLFDQDIQ